MATTTLPAPAVSYQDLVQLATERLKRIEVIKTEVAAENDDNLEHPTPLFEQLAAEES